MFRFIDLHCFANWYIVRIVQKTEDIRTRRKKRLTTLGSGVIRDGRVQEGRLLDGAPKGSTIWDRHKGAAALPSLWKPTRPEHQTSGSPTGQGFSLGLVLISLILSRKLILGFYVNSEFYQRLLHFICPKLPLAGLLHGLHNMRKISKEIKIQGTVWGSYRKTQKIKTL